MPEDLKATNDPYDIGLPEFRVESRNENSSGDYLYVLIPRNRPSECPECHSTTLHIHRDAKRKVKDLPVFGHRTGLLIKGKAYRCTNCKAIIRPEYPSIDGHMTIRLKEQIKNESINMPFAQLGKLYDFSDTKIKELFKEHIQDLRKDYVLTMPQVLGIDEVHFQHNYYCLFVDVNKETGHIIEMTESRSKETVKNILKSMAEPERLRLVTIDMWRPYREAVATLFPNIPIVIDRFHVIKELLKVLERIRKGISSKIKEQKERASLKNNRFLILTSCEDLTEVQYKRIQELFEDYPQFETPYLLKEAFRSIYATAKTKTEAEKMYKKWCESCYEENITEFDGFMATVSNWHDEIFAYFDLTCDNRANAQTESLNNRIKKIAGEGRGYSFDILRDKAVFMKETTPSCGHFDFNNFDTEESNG